MLEFLPSCSAQKPRTLNHQTQTLPPKLAALGTVEEVRAAIDWLASEKGGDLMEVERALEKGLALFPMNRKENRESVADHRAALAEAGVGALGYVPAQEMTALREVWRVNAEHTAEAGAAEAGVTEPVAAEPVAATEPVAAAPVAAESAAETALKLQVAGLMQQLANAQSNPPIVVGAVSPLPTPPTIFAAAGGQGGELATPSGASLGMVPPPPP